MRRRLWISLIGSVVIVIAALAGNLATGNTPILGLDLQGGVSVILAPTEEASGDDLLGARDQIRSTLERNGIAEPDVRVQGSNLVVDLPGVNDQQAALDLVSVSGIVELRPVVNIAQCQAATQPQISVGDTETSPVVNATTEDGVEVTGSIDDAPADEAPADEAPADEPVVEDAPTDDGEQENGAAATSASVSAPIFGLRRSAPEPDTTDPTGTDPVTTEPPTTEPPTTEPPTTEPPTTEPATSEPATSDVIDDEAPVDGEDAPVPTIPADTFDPATIPGVNTNGADLLPSADGFALCVGPAPAGASGEVFAKDGATTQLNLGWSVQAELRPEGQSVWNRLATECFNRTPTCPSPDGNSPGQLAIVLDGIIQSAPTVNQPVFDDFVQITGNFSEEEARQLTRVINRGAFPVAVEAEEARTVSPSAGGDSLRAAIIAGLIGVALVLTFLVLYYRWLALVIISGLSIWAATVFSAASFISGATNYALSLAGVTGIIVAVGVTVDSYVVFFERMKDEIRNGRTLRNAAPRSFNSTWRTIWSADLVSMIGALILFWLSVGSVRGFALYLGITTLCDLLVCFFFTRPAVLLIARSKFMAGRRAFGLEVAS